MKRFFGGMIVGGLLALAGCTQPASIRVGINDWPPCAVWAVAQEQGYFGENQVEVVRYSNWSDNMDALYKGKLDFTHSTYLNAIYYSGRGEAAQMVLSLDTIEGSDGLVINSKYASGADLAGARIAVEVATDEHFLLYKALTFFQVSLDAVTIVSSTSEAAKDLFLAGEVDACFTYDPYLTEAAAQGKLVWTTKDAPGYMVDTLLMSEKLATAHPEEGQLVVDAWFKALAYIREHKAETHALMAKSLDMKVEDFTPFFDAFQFYSAQDNRRIFRSDSFSATLREQNQFLLKANAISSGQPVEALTNPRFAEASP